MRSEGKSMRTVSIASLLVLMTVIVGGCAPPPPPPRPVALAQPLGYSRTVLVRVGDYPLPATAPASPAATGPATAPATAPAEGPDETAARAAFETVVKILGRTGVYASPEVYVVTVPRDDLTLVVEGMEVPTAAGVASIFYFSHCPCGKTRVVGQFCVEDYEANDVIDALRAARIEIASVAPMVLHTRQAPVLIRFFAEGQAEPIARAIREGLRWTGKERMAPATHP
jgi:hypothetical protein